LYLIPLFLSYFADLPNTDTFKVFTVADEAGRLLIKIAKESYAVWENGQDMYKYRSECQYWMTSLITLMVHYVLRNTNNDAYEENDDDDEENDDDDEENDDDDEENDYDDDDFTDISDGEGSYIIDDENSSLLVLLSNSSEDEDMTEEEEAFALLLKDKDCGSHRDAATSLMIKVEEVTCSCTESTAQFQSEVTFQVQDKDKESEAQIKTTNLSVETTLFSSTVEQSNNSTTYEACETLSITQREDNSTYCNISETIIESVLVNEEETALQQSNLAISGNKEVSDCVEKDNMSAHTKDGIDNESCVHNLCDHTGSHMDGESNKENHGQQHHTKQSCCDHQFAVSQNASCSRTGFAQHKHTSKCSHEHEHHPKKQLKREKKEKKEVKSNEEKYKLHVMEQAKIHQEREAYRKKTNMLQTVLERIKNSKFVEFNIDSSTRCHYFMDFVRLLLSSFQQDFSTWLSCKYHNNKKKCCC
jgi:hypothetical protein